MEIEKVDPSWKQYKTLNNNLMIDAADLLTVTCCQKVQARCLDID